MPGFLFSRPNRPPRPPHLQASVAPLPLLPRGAYLLGGKGAGEPTNPIRTKGQTLWYSRYSIIPLRALLCGTDAEAILSFAMSRLCATNRTASFLPSTSWYGKANPSLKLMVIGQQAFFPLSHGVDNLLSHYLLMLTAISHGMFPLRPLIVQAAILLPPPPP